MKMSLWLLGIMLAHTLTCAMNDPSSCCPFALLPYPILSIILCSPKSSEEMVQQIQSLKLVCKWFASLPYATFCKEWEAIHQVSFRQSPLMTAAIKGFKGVVCALYPYHPKPSDSKPVTKDEKFFNLVYQLYCPIPHNRLTTQDINDYCGAINTDEVPIWITHLMYAVINKYQVIMKLLIKHGARVNEPDSERNKPIHYALENQQSLQILLERGADPNLPDAIGRTPLATIHENLMKISEISEYHQELMKIKKLLENYGARM